MKHNISEVTSAMIIGHKKGKGNVDLHPKILPTVDRENAVLIPDLGGFLTKTHNPRVFHKMVSG